MKKTPAFYLCAVALLASFQRGACQVYGLCPIGYANVAMTPGYNFVANPFNWDNTNSISTVLVNPNPPDGAKVYVWDITNQFFLPPATFSSSNGTNGWDTNFLLPPGKGFVFYTTAPWTNTFVGYIDPCPGETNFIRIAGGNKFSLVRSEEHMSELQSHSFISYAV